MVGNELERFGVGGCLGCIEPEPTTCGECAFFTALASNGEGVCNRHGLKAMTADELARWWVDEPEKVSECPDFEEYREKKGVLSWSA